MLSQKIKTIIRDVPDFPKPGIIFKDITPVLQNADLCREITSYIQKQNEGIAIDAVMGIESRGFLFGMLVANALNVPFIPVRKAGKLPYKTISQSYDLEYGSATIEIHNDALKPGANVMIHDDLLATGGTANAAALLAQKLGAKIACFSFIIELDFLNGRQLLTPFNAPVHSIINY
jgi:adenine phosphoribosyltransferase